MLLIIIVITYVLNTYQSSDYNNMQNYLYTNMCLLCLGNIVVSKIAKYLCI